jgi:hypothetical protein
LLFVCTLKVHKKFLANNKFTKEAIPSVKIPHDIQNLKNSVSKVRNWDKLCTLIFDEMSIMLHVGYDIIEFHGFEMDKRQILVGRQHLGEPVG